jgi:acetyl esterase/lipase
VTAFVLRYRLGPRYHHPIQIGDAQRAIRIVRSRAPSSEYDVARIGMMGFSAGGHLTATAGTRFDAGKPDAADAIERASSRPDFLILAYPVISFQPEIAGPNVLSAYSNSGRNLLGDNPPAALLRELSAETQVSANTPPTFLFHTTADTLVPVENSLAFYAALRKAHVPAEMHVFEPGAHGAGMGLTDPALSAWPTLLMNWMRQRGLLTAPAGSK